MAQIMGPEPERDYVRGISFQGAGGRFPVPESYPTSFGLGGVGEMLPSYANRISLNSRRTDKWGIPIAHIRCQLGDNDRILIGAHASGELTKPTTQVSY